MSINIFMNDQYTCSAPFIAMSFLNIVRPCCQIIEPSTPNRATHPDKPLDFYLERRQQVQKSYIDYNSHPGCDTCLRQNHPYANFFNANWPIQRNNNYSSDIKQLHIQFNNKCNLACRMCSPSFSSMHDKESGGNGEIRHNIAPHTKLYSQLVDKIDEIEYLYLTGGESFLDPTTWDFLEKCVTKDRAKHIQLQINTNGTVSLNKHQLNILDKFKQRFIHISVDGTGSMAEYTRTGLVWDKWSKNLDKYIKYFTNESISIVYTVSALNVWQFGEDCDFYKKEFKFGLHWSTLTHPHGLSISNLSNHAKQHLNDKYKNTRYKNITNLMNDVNEVQNVSIANYIDMLDERAIKYNKWPNYIRYSTRFPDYWKLINTNS